MLPLMYLLKSGSLSARRAWIEMQTGKTEIVALESLSARRAWIEIVAPSSAPNAELVALRKESVDRNIIIDVKERGRKLVALRKESVDRNRQSTQKAMNMPRSLSARRAWIEIAVQLGCASSLNCRSPQGERG